MNIFKAFRFLVVVATVTPASAQTLYWDNSGGTANDWGSLANWSSVVGGGTDPLALPATTDTVIFSATSVAAGQTVNLNAARGVLGLSFTSGQAHSLLGGGTNQILTLGTAGIVKTGTGAATLGSATAGQQVSVALSADQTWANNNNTGAITVVNGVAASSATARILTLGGTSTAANTISGVIANNGAGVLSLVKNDAGLWILSNTANTFTGAVTVNGGELQAYYAGVTAGTYANLGTGAVTVNSGATLRFKTNSGSAAVQWNNAINLNNATLAHEDSNITLAGSIALTGANTVTGRWNNKNLTLSGVISGTGALNKTNTSGQDTVLILSNSNTFSGGLTVSDGIVRLTNAGALGTNASVLVQNNENPTASNTNSLQLSGGLTYGAGKTLTLRNNSTSNIGNARTALENLSGNNAWAGNILLDQGTNQTLTSTAGTLTLSGNITQSATPSTSMFIRGASSGVIAGGLNLGAAQLYKTDAGTWTVNSSGNTHGNIVIGNGTLVANNNDAFDPAANLTLGEGSAAATVFTINATFTQALANIANAATTTGAQTINGAGTLSTGGTMRTYTVTDVAAADDLTIATPIAGTGGFTKQGAGTLFLNGSTITGPVALGAGTLRGTFTPAGGLAVNGGTLIPGSTTTVFALNTPTLAFGAGAHAIPVNLGNGPSDVINVANAGGLTTAGGTTTFTITPSGGFTTGNNYPLITYTGATPGTSGFALAPLPGRVAGNITDTGTAIALAVTGNDKVKWTGATSAVWDINTTANWQTVTGGAATNYLEGDDLVFADGAANTTITLGVAVNPANIEFTNTAVLPYAITGAGSLAGGLTLSKTGDGLVTLGGSAAHAYTGATTVSAGTFAVNQAASGLTATSGVDVGAGATLRLFSGNANFTFSRNLTGAGTVEIDPNASGTAGSRDITLSGTNTGFSGTLLLQPSGTVAANGSFRTVSTTAQANLGSAAIVVKPGGQLWWTGAINNNLTLSGYGYQEAAGGVAATAATGADGSSPAVPTGTYAGNSGIGALRMQGGASVSGTVTLVGDTKIMSHNATGTLSGNLSNTASGDTLVVGGGSAASVLVLTGDNSALERIWVNGGGTTGNNVLQIGDGGTTGTLGSGDVILYTDAAGAHLRIQRSDGYTLAAGQKILAAHNGTATNLTRSQVMLNVTGTGFSNNGNLIDLSDGTNRGVLQVGTTVASATARLTGVIDVGQLSIGANNAVNTSNAVLTFGADDGSATTTVTTGGISLGTGGSTTLGSNTTGAVLNIHPGVTLTANGNIQLGETAGASTTVNQFGGAVSTAHMRIGHWGQETGVYNLSGGTLTFTGGSPAANPSGTGEQNGGIYLGIDGRGIFNQTGGTVTTNWIVLDNRGNTVAGTNMASDLDQFNLSAGTLNLQSTWGVQQRNTGEFNFSGGTVRIDNTGTGTGTGANLTVPLDTVINVSGTGATLDTNGAGNRFTLTRNVTGAGTLTTSGAGTVQLSTGTTQSFVAILAGTSPVEKIGAGTTTLAAVNTYSGATSVTAGRLDVTGSANNSAFTVAATLGGEGSIGNLTLQAGSTLAINPNTAGALSVAALGSAASTTVSLDAIPTALGPMTVVNYSGARSGATTDFVLASAANFRAPVFNDTGSAITLDTGAKALVWNGTSGGQWDLNTSSRWNAAEADKFFWGDQVTFDDTGVDTAAVTLTGDLRPGSITVNTSTKNYTLTASAGNVIAGNASLLKAGASILTMAGNTANPFTGGTTIREGAIRVQNGGSLGTGTITLGDAGTGAGNTALYIDTNRTTVSVPVVVSNNGSGTATLGTRATITGTGSFGFSNITLQRDVVLDSNAADRSDYTNIAGTGNITITGAARTLFNSANTFVGDVVVSPSGAGGHFQSGVATAGNQNYIPDTSNLTVNNFAGATQAEYRLSTGGETIAGLSGNGTIDVNAINGTLTVGFGDASSTFSGQMINGGASVFSLTKTGAGTQVLTGSNTYTGNTVINGGVLELGVGGKMYNGAYNNTAVVTVNAGATWRVRDYSYGGVGQLADYAQRRVLNGGTIEVTGNTHSSGQDFTVNAAGGTFRYTPAGQTLTLSGNGNTDITLNGPLTFDAVGNISVTGATALLTGGGSLTKTGSGTLTLSQNNTYTGGTQVQGGTLVINGTPVAPGMISVSSSATLGGFGTVRDVEIADGGFLSPGQVTATSGENHFTLRNLGLFNGSILEFDLDAPLLDPMATFPGLDNDALLLTGDLVLDGQLRIRALPGYGTPVYGDRWLLATYSGTLTDNTLEVDLAGSTGLPPAQYFVVDAATDGYVYLMLVPEPGTAGLICFGLLLLRRRFRRR